MFQFRAFPSYDYLIHRMILEYCSDGFPHSDICGSMLICSSPQLFAAYHVLLRLLMPRHSPCALLRLTSSAQVTLRSAVPPLPKKSFGLPGSPDTRFARILSLTQKVCNFLGALLLRFAQLHNTAVSQTRTISRSPSDLCE